MHLFRIKDRRLDVGRALKGDFLGASALQVLIDTGIEQRFHEDPLTARLITFCHAEKATYKAVKSLNLLEDYAE